MNGKRHDIETEWYEGGSKEWEITRVDGKQYGMETAWRENGKKLHEGIPRNYDLQGATTKWRDNGMKAKEIYFIRTKPYEWMEWSKEGNVTNVSFPPLPRTNNKPKSKQ